MQFILSAKTAVEAAALLIVQLLMGVKIYRFNRNGLRMKRFQP